MVISRNVRCEGAQMTAAEHLADEIVSAAIQ
jgi:hypothetical protein